MCSSNFVFLVSGCGYYVFRVPSSIYLYVSNDHIQTFEIPSHIIIMKTNTQGTRKGRVEVLVTLPNGTAQSHYPDPVHFILRKDPR